jgi:uncharacterized small protein (DUF1192 family)
LSTETLSGHSDDWRDMEIRYLRDEIARLNAELEAIRRRDPMRNFEMRERGLDL